MKGKQLKKRKDFLSRYKTPKKFKFLHIPKRRMIKKGVAGKLLKDNKSLERYKTLAFINEHKILTNIPIVISFRRKDGTIFSFNAIKSDYVMTIKDVKRLLEMINNGN